MIKITLSSANLGSEATEADFDAWANYVIENVDEGAGVMVGEVDQFRFGDSGEDKIEGVTTWERDAIRTWLNVTGWEAFCGSRETA